MISLNSVAEDESAAGKMGMGSDTHPHHEFDFSQLDLKTDRTG